MIEEYFKLVALVRKYHQDYEDLHTQVSGLRFKITERYCPSHANDVVVRENGQYYLINCSGSIRPIDLVESEHENLYKMNKLLLGTRES